jgi:hypothetical protein
MKKGLIIGIVFFVLIGLGLLSAKFFSGEDDWICRDGEWIKHGNPKAGKPTQNCGKAIENKVDDPEEQLQAAEEANILVFNPKENAKISSPFDLEGKARVFENVVSIRLKDTDGKVLFQGTTEAKSPDTGKFGLFQEEISYSTIQTKGILEVFESSAKDGSEVNKVAIPVKFVNENNPDEIDGN